MKKLLAYLLTAATVCASLLMGAQPASASGVMQFYDGTSNVSTLLYTADPGRHALNFCYRLPNGAESRTSYIDNGSSSKWYVYTDSGCAGVPGTIWAHSYGQMTTPWNNSISTYMRIS